LSRFSLGVMELFDVAGGAEGFGVG